MKNCLVKKQQDDAYFGIITPLPAQNETSQLSECCDDCVDPNECAECSDCIACIG